MSELSRFVYNKGHQKSREPTREISWRSEGEFGKKHGFWASNTNSLRDFSLIPRLQEEQTICLWSVQKEKEAFKIYSPVTNYGHILILIQSDWLVHWKAQHYNQTSSNQRRDKTRCMRIYAKNTCFVLLSLELRDRLSRRLSYNCKEQAVVSLLHGDERCVYMAGKRSRFSKH